MPNISDAVIRSIYEVCGDFRFPVEQYCIGCQNCEHYGFPCANCALYVFGGNLGPGSGEGGGGDDAGSGEGGDGGDAGSGGGSDMEVESPSLPPLYDDIDPESPLGLLIQYQIQN